MQFFLFFWVEITSQKKTLQVWDSPPGGGLLLLSDLYWRDQSWCKCFKLIYTGLMWCKCKDIRSNFEVICPYKCLQFGTWCHISWPLEEPCIQPMICCCNMMWSLQENWEFGRRGQRLWSIEVDFFLGKEFSLVFFKGSLSNFQLFGFLKVLFFLWFRLTYRKRREIEMTPTKQVHVPRIFFRGWNHVVKSRPVFIGCFRGWKPTVPSIIWELIHKLIRHEIRIPFQFKYFKSMSLRWVLNSPQISLKNTDFYPFFLEGGVRTFSTLGGGFLRYLSNFSPRKLGEMNPFDFFAK